MLLTNFKNQAEPQHFANIWLAFFTLQKQDRTRLKSKVFSLDILILLIWTNATRTNVTMTNVAQTGVTLTVVLFSQESIGNNLLKKFYDERSVSG